MASKLCSLSRSTARVCEDDVSDLEAFGRISKIPKMPKKSYRLEGRGRSSKIRKSSSRCQNFTASMIPRPEWKKCYKKSLTSDTSKTKLKKKIEECEQQQQEQEEQQQEQQVEEEEVVEVEEEGEKQEEKQEGEVEDNKAASKSCSLEAKINEDLANFKDNVLRIPEFWTDAGQTVTNVLKNAVNIVSKQYPTADMDTFEQEIQNILKATEVVKSKILTKTESIISEANKLYALENDTEEGPIDDEIDELKDEGNEKKSIEELKETNESEKDIKSKKESSRGSKKGLQENEKKAEEAGVNSKHRVTRKKSKLRLDCIGEPRIKGLDKNIIQSCGDVIRPDKKVSSRHSNNSGLVDKIRSVEDKSCQTPLKWLTRLSQEEILAGLNKQILELQQLCQDHISKFKSFNLQIKLRGICSKAQSTSKEIQILNEEKYKLAEKNSKLNFHNRDLESTIKQKEQDLHQKDRLISQQKKLLNVRDELIEMLKSKCKVDEVDHV